MGQHNGGSIQMSSEQHSQFGISVGDVLVFLLLSGRKTVLVFGAQAANHFLDG